MRTRTSTALRAATLALAAALVAAAGAAGPAAAAPVPVVQPEAWSTTHVASQICSTVFRNKTIKEEFTVRYQTQKYGSQYQYRLASINLLTTSYFTDPNDVDLSPSGGNVQYKAPGGTVWYDGAWASKVVTKETSRWRVNYSTAFPATGVSGFTFTRATTVVWLPTRFSLTSGYTCSVQLYF